MIFRPFHRCDAANQTLEVQVRDSHHLMRPRQWRAVAAVIAYFLIHILQRSEVDRQVEDAANQTLEVQVRDSHLTGRALLGHVSFPLSRLPPDGALDAWLPVLDPQPITANAKPVGEIHLKLTYKVRCWSLLEMPADTMILLSLSVGCP